MAQHITTLNEIRERTLAEGFTPDINDIIFADHGPGSKRHRAFTIGEIGDLLMGGGGLTEIDFDFSASWINHTMDLAQYPPSFMQIVFAATWDNNDFKYGFPIDDSNIFTTTRGSYRYEQGVSGFNNDMPVMGHVRMVGVIGNAGTRRLFIGAFQPRNDVYIRMKISNVRVRGNLGAIEASAT